MLLVGAVFVPGVTLVALTEHELVLRYRGRVQAVRARVVLCQANGVAMEFLHWTPERRIALQAWLEDARGANNGGDAHASGGAERAKTDDVDAGADTNDADTNDLDAEPDDDGADGSSAPRPLAAVVGDKLRGLSAADQIKRALRADLAERVQLARIYGKGVWEALLRNPRISAPEVMRLARLGSMPTVLLEQICTNGTWLAVPEIRRALLGNPRLPVEHVPRILRMLPKQELRLVPTQMSYSSIIREHARRLLKSD